MQIIIPAATALELGLPFALIQSSSTLGFSSFAAVVDSKIADAVNALDRLLIGTYKYI